MHLITVKYDSLFFNCYGFYLCSEILAPGAFWGFLFFFFFQRSHLWGNGIFYLLFNQFMGPGAYGIGTEVAGEGVPFNQTHPPSEHLYWIPCQYLPWFLCFYFKLLIYTSLIMRKPVFRVFHQVRLKPACAATEATYRFEISDIEARDVILSRQRTTKVLIRLRGYGRFCHDVAHILL